MFKPAPATFRSTIILSDTFCIISMKWVMVRLFGIFGYLDLVLDKR